ncbi:MAG: sigma-70 family RNA polymerase sigma factor [Erysipelotrichaceae bacterium]|nr:sigma-70 family RNA polymerase sigma factor [Erysipelotrichaceae bacterium]MDO5085402.1 sigma-70 family RNA polymerase sigma factor [Erysipelotrichaceae bacterium]
MEIIGEHELLELIDLLKNEQNKLTAFTTVYLTFYHPLKKYAINKLNQRLQYQTCSSNTQTTNHQLAEEIADEVLLAVYQQIHTLKNPQSFLKWLYTIADIKIYNVVRINYNYVKYQVPIKNIHDKGYEIDYHEMMRKEKNWLVLDRIMEDLDEIEKNILKLYLFEGKRFTVICKVLNITYDKCIYRYKRAIHKIRMKLKLKF